MSTLRIVCIAGIFTAAIAGALASDAKVSVQPDVAFEAAFQSETVRGDLPEAIRRYREVMALPGVSRAISARALLRTGICQERMGQRREAWETYRKVAAAFSDQLVVSVAKARLEAWSGPRNLRFEEGTPGKVPPGWFVPSLPKDADFLAELRRGEGCRSRAGCALVTVPVNVPRGVGNLMQSFSASAYVGRYVRLRAWLRLERFFLTSFGFRMPEEGDGAQMWLNIESDNRRNVFADNMDDRPVRGADWTRCEIVAEVVPDARFINFGVMSIGGGRVWVDEVSFDVITRAQWVAARTPSN